MKYIIPEIPPSLNRAVGKNNPWGYRGSKEEWTEKVYYACLPVKHKPPEKAVVTITYFFKTRGRRDPDNYCGKYILDGLTQAGVIKDDSFDCIELRLRGGYDKHNPRTEIEVTPYDPDI